MESESKDPVTGTRKLVVLFGVIFCSTVSVILVVLYYPFDSVEKEFDDLQLVTPVGSFKDWDPTSPDESKVRVEDVAKALEDFGAAFLALIAVCCVAVGLTCLVCACCIFK